MDLGPGNVKRMEVNVYLAFCIKQIIGMQAKETNCNNAENEKTDRYWKKITVIGRKFLPLPEIAQKCYTDGKSIY